MTTTGQQVNPVQVLVPQDTSHKAHLESCMHVHQPVSQVCKPGELLALRMLIGKHFCRDHDHSKLFCCTLNEIS